MAHAGNPQAGVRVGNGEDEACLTSREGTAGGTAGGAVGKIAGGTVGGTILMRPGMWHVVAHDALRNERGCFKSRYWQQTHGVQREAAAVW